ncbi:3-oxoacyl-[acyl-carrier-protein] reductase FabG [compost metagenome]
MNTTAFITGGASGLGKAAAKRLLSMGWTVAIADLGAERLAEAVGELGPLGKVLTFELDVRDESAVNAAIDSAAEQMGSIGALVTSAGISHQGSLMDNDSQAWQRVLDINLTGSYLCAQAASRHMVKAKSGSIVFIASISATHAWSSRVAYCSSKAGVLGLMRASAIDLAPFGVRANSVSPGPVRTPQTDVLHNELVQNAVKSAVPMARYGLPGEIGDVIAFLCTDDARYVTGHDLTVDGGLTAAAILYDASKNPQSA